MTGSDSKYKASLLAVDDSPHDLLLLKLILEKLGYFVLTAPDCDTAEKILENQGTDAFECVISDYRMPQKTGLDLLKWVHEQDRTLSTILITAEGDKHIVTQSLRQGLVDYIDKPVKTGTLSKSLEKAIEETRSRRLSQIAETSVKQVSKIQNFILGIQKSNSPVDLEICHAPLHEAGGDFINLIPFSQNSFLLLVADVSGHDLQSAFIAAYFQGIFRGMIEGHSAPLEIFDFFNRFLFNEWNNIEDFSRIPTSISGVSILVDYSHEKIEIIRNGFPSTVFVHADGACKVFDMPSPPLGWNSSLDADSHQIEMGDTAAVYLWSDGLEEFAETMQLPPITLCHFLLKLKDPAKQFEFLKKRTDDVLAIRMAIQKQPPQDSVFEPIFITSYAGSDFQKIDKLQNEWKKVIRFAVPSVSDDRMWDILLCFREVVLNGLCHGCKKRDDSFLRIEILHSEQGSGLLRLHAKDGGPGFDFSVLKKDFDIDNYELIYRGLGLIRMLSHNIEVYGNGNELFVDCTCKI